MNTIVNANKGVSDANIIKISYKSSVDKEISDFEIIENLNITEKASVVLKNIIIYQYQFGHITL